MIMLSDGELRGNSSGIESGSLGLANPSAVSFGRFFIIARPLHIPYQAFLFTQLLKTSNHLLNRFTCPGLDFQHWQNFLSKTVFGSIATVTRNRQKDYKPEF